MIGAQIGVYAERGMQPRTGRFEIDVLLLQTIHHAFAATDDPADSIPRYRLSEQFLSRLQLNVSELQRSGIHLVELPFLVVVSHNGVLVTEPVGVLCRLLVRVIDYSPWFLAGKGCRHTGHTVCDQNGCKQWYRSFHDRSGYRLMRDQWNSSI